MKKVTENKIRMFNVAHQVLLSYQDVWSTNEGMKEVSDELGKDIKGINAVRAGADASTEGITDDKEVIYDDVIDTMMEIAGPLATLAKRAGNLELFNKVWFSDSYLRSLKENELVQKARELYQLALPNKVGLVKNNVTAEEIENLNELADALEEKVPQPRETVSVRVASKISLGQLVRKTSLLLKEQLDGLVENYRRKNPEFWNAYFTARKLVNGVRHEKKEDGMKK